MTPWRKILLYAVSICLFENGAQLEIKTHRKSADQPAFPSEIGRKQFRTKPLTVPELSWETKNVAFTLGTPLTITRLVFCQMLSENGALREKEGMLWTN